MNKDFWMNVLALWAVGLWIPGLFIFYPLMLMMGHVVRVAVGAHSDDARYNVGDFAFEATLLYFFVGFIAWIIAGTMYG